MVRGVLRSDPTLFKLYSSRLGLWHATAKSGVQYFSDGLTFDVGLFRRRTIFSRLNAECPCIICVHHPNGLFPGAALRTAWLQLVAIF